MKFYILVFWCQMNYADAARIKAVMINCGFLYCETIEDADIIIFDTCSIKQKAEDKITWRLQNIPSNKKIWITWCMVQHNLRNSKIQKAQTWKTITGLMKKGNFINNIETKKPTLIGISNENFKNITKNNQNTNLFINHAFNPLFVNLQKKFKNLELIFRIDDIGFLPFITKKLWYKIDPEAEIINEYAEIIPNFQQMEHKEERENPAKAYIPISTWCNQFCSFCIVPYARGLEKYYSIEQIIEETKKHLNNWVKEITLIWQIVNKHPQFNEIIKKVLKLPWLERLRYTSPYPSYYNKELFKLHETEKKLCPHIHIPVQSGSNTILKKMFRGYTVEEFKNFIDQIKLLKRQISITTDIIVGFPNETEKDFQETLNIVEYSKFDMIYIGIYSPRKGTYAEQRIPDNISYSIKHQRRDTLNKLLTKISTKNNQKEIWQSKKILIDKIISHTKTFLIQWHTDNMKTIEWSSTKKYNKWDFVQKTITKTQSLKLFS